MIIRALHDYNNVITINILFDQSLVSYKVLFYEMWHAYQYGQGRLKLVKDLKTGQAHLRVSLIDKEEINDLGRVAYFPSRSTKNAKITTKSMTNQWPLLPLSRKTSNRRAQLTLAIRKRWICIGADFRAKN